MTQHPTTDGDDDGDPGGASTATTTTTRDGDGRLPLLTEMPSWAAWCEKLDASLVRHGITPPMRARTTPPELRKKVGNVAGRYPKPPQAVPVTPQWLLDIRDREEAQVRLAQQQEPSRELRIDAETTCYGCLARPIDTEHYRVEHHRMLYLCADCRELAREVGDRAVHRNPAVPMHTVLDALFRYVWRIIPEDGAPQEDIAVVTRRRGNGFTKGSR